MTIYKELLLEIKDLKDRLIVLGDQNNKESVDEWVTMEELAKYLRVSLSKLRHSKNYLGFPHTRVGRQVLFNLTEVNKILKESSISSFENKLNQ
jgi:excisionase family DNA binding protein